MNIKSEEVSMDDVVVENEKVTVLDVTTSRGEGEGEAGDTEDAARDGTEVSADTKPISSGNDANVDAISGVDNQSPNANKIDITSSSAASTKAGKSNIQINNGAATDPSAATITPSSPPKGAAVVDEKMSSVEAPSPKAKPEPSTSNMGLQHPLSVDSATNASKCKTDGVIGTNDECDDEMDCDRPSEEKSAHDVSSTIPKEGAVPPTSINEADVSSKDATLEQASNEEISTPHHSLAAAVAATSTHERRGSGYLLLAAEAMERSNSREKQIRHAAMQLAAASAATNADDTSSITSNEVAAGGGVLLQGGSLTAHDTTSMSLQQVFQMPSLRADQLLSNNLPPPGYSASDVPEVDDNLRGQVYLVAARLKQQEPSSSSSSSSPPSLPPTNPTKSSSRRLSSGKPRLPPQKHVYHDYSNVLPVVKLPPNDTDTPRRKSGGVQQPFPEKLMDMLDKESLLHVDIISWCPHGRAFIVKKPKEFTSKLMEKYFRQSKLTSFQRQLNLYGFRRITQGIDSGAYYHELFLKDRRHLCTRMVRQKVKGTGHKQPTDVTTEPNFYKMPLILPLDQVASSRATARECGTGEEITSQDLSLPPLSTQSTNQQALDSDNVLMNSPGINAAKLLKQLSTVGSPDSQFNLGVGAISSPPLTGNSFLSYASSTYTSSPSRLHGFQSIDNTYPNLQAAMASTSYVDGLAKEEEAGSGEESEHITAV
ncbi:predicted protein [Thalassiosira pseudonana CCMP1335]|uniref:HSF-type DNA-binding domain-containing protein n=1 Tax=Thalassiosira pseudonana TaxID=35128 RepID=B8CE14_THAPS|nr:predicted protein [Thalassiosira pseudonana CCMP1335]EED88190.1 predicted protein [Thalassiosira pseudonana CCMP1335]